LGSRVLAAPISCLLSIRDQNNPHLVVGVLVQFLSHVSALDLGKDSTQALSSLRRWLGGRSLA
jgi:hypothetical protein